MSAVLRPPPRRPGLGIAAAGGILALCAFWGFAIAYADVNAAVMCAALIACAALMFDFRVGVVLLIVLMPVSASQLFPRAMFGITGLNPLNLLLAATLVSYLLHSLFKWKLTVFLPPRLALLYLAPVVLAGLIGSRHVGEIAPHLLEGGQIEIAGTGAYLRDMLMKPLALVVFALLVAAAVTRSKNPDRFIVPIIGSVVAMALLAVGYFLASGASLGAIAQSSARGFFSPLGLHANDLGRLYAVAYALLLFSWARSRSAWVSLALVGAMGLTIVALLLTFSRGAFVGFLAVNVLFLMSRRHVLASIALVLAALGAALLMPEALFERLSKGFESGANAVSAGRIDGIWKPLLPELAKHPLFGNGLGSTMWSAPMRAQQMLPVGHPHNAFLRAALDLGLVGFVLVCAYWAHAWNGFRKLADDAELSQLQRGLFEGAAAGLLCFLAAGLVGSSLTPSSEQAFLWLAIGLMYGHLARKNENPLRHQ